MKYMGSKSRIAKYIVPILQQCIDKNHISYYIEPFCGGCNVIDKIRCEHRIANDLNTHLVALLSYVAKGGKLLDEVPKDLYDKVRSNYKSNLYDDWYIGNIGFLASYNGRFFDGGYAKSGYENGKLRDYYQESKRNLENQADNLRGIEFLNNSYELIDIPQLSLVYCDPPYANTKQFANSSNFNTDLFWENMRTLSLNSYVFISEENAPDDFIPIWEQAVLRSIKSTNKSTAVEKLYIYKNGLCQYLLKSKSVKKLF